MPADTLSADGAPTSLTLPPALAAGFGSYAYVEAGYAAMNLNSNEIVVAFDAGEQSIAEAVYDVAGHLLYSSVLRSVGDSAGSVPNNGPSGTYTSLTAPAITTMAGGGVAIGYGAESSWTNGEVDPVGRTNLVYADGTLRSGGYGLGGLRSDGTVYGPVGTPELFTNGANGIHVEWMQQPSSTVQGGVWEQSQYGDGGDYSFASRAPDGVFHAYAAAPYQGGSVMFFDNAVVQASGPAATVPGEPAHAITTEAAATLAGGARIALAWADAGTARVSLYDPASHTFGTISTLDTGGADNMHVVALPDGGYAVSWTNGGQYKGEVFAGDGTGGGVLSLTGDFAGLTVYGDLYTTGLGGDGQYVVQTYAINGWTGGEAGVGAGLGSSVTTSDASYTAPDGVGVITLNGTHQTVQANNGGDVIWSNDSGNTLMGGSGNDIFHLGRGGDVASGGGGDDAFVFSDIPWASGRITDFNAGDVLDLTALVNKLGSHTTDPWGLGFLKLVDDGLGDTQLWARYQTSGSNSTWWEVTTLDHVSLASLQINGDLVALTPGSGGTGGGTTGQTYTSDNNGDHWTGTAGDDLFHLGRGGDVVTGAGGNDTYTFAELPWAGGHITDFNAGDTLDLTGLMSTTADTGTDGFADGYLKITSDSSGDAQVWAQYATSGANAGWWLVETLDGVSAGSLQTSGDVVTVGSGGSGTGPTSVTTSDSNYVAPAYVTAITLDGSRQHIDASATNGVEITSNNTGNVLIGGSGADLFHLGRGGDLATGGAGADVFAYAETPWGAGAITDFNGSQGDAIDVNGLLHASGYSGSDPFADGYLKYVTDTGGSAELWSNLNQPGNDGWWLVVTLDGVSTSSLHYSAGLIT